MIVVMKLIGIAGRPIFSNEQWLRGFDVDAYNGYGKVDATVKREEAMRFESAAAAMAAWNTVSKVRPTRDDGKPNKPLTAFTVEIEPA